VGYVVNLGLKFHSYKFIVESDDEKGRLSAALFR
jgi:hypothetical protein